MKTKKEKNFDTVKMMRKIRDQISKETMHMSFEKLKKYMKERLQKSQVVMEKRKNYSSNNVKSKL